MDRPDDTYWGHYARTYDEGVDYVVGSSLREALFMRLSRERELGDLLECGCGTGYFTRAVAGRANRVVATDLSGNMLAAAGIRLAGLSRITKLRSDCGCTPFPPTSFDTALMANILNTLTAPLPALREMHRVLKYEGLLIAIAYTDHYADTLERIVIGKRYYERFGLPPPGELRNYSPRRIESLLARAGFTIAGIEVLGGGPVKAIYARAIKGYITDDASEGPHRNAPVA